MRKAASILFLVVVALLDVSAMRAWSMHPSRYVEVEIPAETAEAEQGFEYSLRLDLGAAVEARTSPRARVFSRALREGDMSGAVTQSHLVVIEDGIALGPAHSQRPAIQTVGNGRFRHWQARLFFSASDSSDVRSNGRRYSVVIPLVYRWSVWAVLLLGNVLALAGVYFAGWRGFGMLLRCVAAGLAALACPLIIRPDRLAAIDSFIPPVLFVAAFAGALITWSLRIPNVFGQGRIRWRRTQRRLVTVLHRWAIPLGMATCVVALAASWSMMPAPHARSHDWGTAAFGRIPASDASGFTAGAITLLDDGTLTAWCHHRPINPVLASIRLWLTGADIHAALVFQALLLGVALAWCASVIGRLYGVWAGIMMYALLYAEAQYSVATAMSEALGLTFACLGLGLLVDGVHARRLGYAALGLLSVTLGLEARAGAQLLAPAAWLAGVWTFRKPRRRLLWTLVALTAAGVGAFGINSSALSIYGSGTLPRNWNSSYVLLGLARGVTWDKADLGFEEQLATLTKEGRVDFRRQKAWELLREDPRPFADMMVRTTVRFCEDLPRHIADRVLPPNRSGAPVEPWVPWLLAAIIVLGATRSLVRVRTPARIVLLAGALGAFASVPLIFANGGWRILASAYPVLAAPIAIAFSTVPRRADEPIRPPAPHRWSRGVSVLLALLAALVVCGPFVVHQLERRTNPTPDVQLAGDEMLMRSSLIRAAVLVSGAEAPRAFVAVDVPAIPPTRFRTLLEYTRSNEGVMRFGEPEPPFVAFNHYPTGHRMIMEVRHLVKFSTPWVRLKVAFDDGSAAFGYSLGRVLEVTPIVDPGRSDDARE